MAPPTVPSLSTTLGDRIPFKVICIIALFIPLAPFMVEYYYLDEGNHTPSSMCSSRYPGYSKLLDMPVILPDGAVQARGWVYPQDAIWRDSGVTHGCPCSVGPCIRPCCRNGYTHNVTYNQTFDGPNLNDFVCGDRIYDKSEESKPLQMLSLTHSKMVSISRRHFPVLEANCEGESGMALGAHLTTDGQVLVRGIISNPAKYGICFDVRDDQLISVEAFICDRRDDTFYLRNFRLAVVDTVVLGSATALLMITLVTYLLVPHLRPAHCGGSVLSYIVALLIDKILTIFFIWCKMYYQNITEYLKPVGHTWSVSMIMWQAVIVYQMWITFNPNKVRVPNRGKGNSKFIWYSVAIWGTIFFTTLFNTFIQGMLFNTILQCVVLLANLCLSVSTLFRLRACLKASKVTQGPESHRHNTKECRWASMFIKFSFLTSLEYTLIILANNTNLMINGLSFLPRSSGVYLVGLETYILYLWGAETFFINVWSKRTWEVLGARFRSKNANNVRIT